MIKIITLSIICLFLLSCSRNGLPESSYFQIKVHCPSQNINHQYNGNNVIITKKALYLKNSGDLKFVKLQENCDLTYYELKNIRPSNINRLKQYIPFNKNYGLVFHHKETLSKEKMIYEESIDID